MSEVKEQAAAAPAPERSGADKNLHTHAFWLFGTIIALAIDRALSETIPYLIKPPANPAFDRFVYSFRLAVFLIVVIRFYLGSVIFFEKAHASDKADEEFPRKSYVIDFVFGLLHFILFFGWAFSIDINTKPVYLFPALLGVLLFYDFLWFVASIKNDPLKLIKLWMAINVASTIAGAAIYVIVLKVVFPTPTDDAYVTAEMLLFIWIILVSVLDIWELMSKKPIFRKIFAWFLD
jgi:hypothetical protein